MRRGEIRWVYFEPVLGSEADKRRPAVVVSNDAANESADRQGRGVVTVVPMTTNTRRIFPFQVLFVAAATGLPRDSKAQAEQVRSVAVERVGDLIAHLDHDHLRALDDALRLHLAL